MSARSFRSVFMVATCAGAALSCYLVSLRVASERAALEEVETQIVLAQRDIRVLQTEIGTRGRLAQLERWNVKVMALSAPTADQFLKGGFELARLTAPEHKPAVEAPVVLASAPAPSTAPEQPSPRAVAPPELLHQASLKTEKLSAVRELEKAQPVRKPAQAPASLKAAASKAPSDTKVTKVQPAKAPPAKPSLSASKSAPKTLAAKSAATSKLPAAKTLRSVARDPLAPLPEKKVNVAATGKTAAAKGVSKKQ